MNKVACPTLSFVNMNAEMSFNFFHRLDGENFILIWMEEL